MLIVEPSYHVLDELDRASLVVRLEACGRICYKSEDKITKDSAVPFVQKVAAQGHNSVLEMAVVTLFVSCDEQQTAAFLGLQPKYVIIDRVGDGLLITGSIRAFRELSLVGHHDKIVAALILFLVDRHPCLFIGINEGTPPLSVDPGLVVRKVALAEVEEMEGALLLRHRYVGVKFVVNRAVTHELVRHRPCSFLQESQRYCRYSNDKFDNQVTFIKPLFYKEDSPEYKLWKQTLAEAEKTYLKLLETSTPQAARTVLPNSCKTEIITYCNLSEWKHIFSLRTSPAAEPSMREIMIPLADELSRRYPALTAF